MFITLTSQPRTGLATNHQRRCGGRSHGGTMNSKLIKAALAGVAVVAVAAGGSTYAAWSDFTTITGNTLGAGILTLNVDANQGSDYTFSQVKMAPGQINSVRNVYVASNDGTSTPNGKLFISIKDLVGHENGCDGNAEVLVDANCATTAASNPGQFVTTPLLQVSSYAVNSPGDCNQSYAPTGKVVTATYGGTLAWWAAQTTPRELTGNGSTLLPAGTGVDKSVLQPNEGLCVSMAMSMWSGSDNASQGDSASFTSRFDLVQAP
jgi:predicted ribosomally synthesized peptide with SipW-like signal peptide